MNANNVQTKAAVTVAEMARMVGLSRARFYQLQDAGIFPLPLYDVSTRRPFYDEEAQKSLSRSAPSQLRDQRQAGLVLRSTWWRTVAGEEANSQHQAEVEQSVRRHRRCRQVARPDGRN